MTAKQLLCAISKSCSLSVQKQEPNDKEHSDDDRQQGRDPHPSHPPQNPTPDPPNPSSAAHGPLLAHEQGEQGMTDWQIIRQLANYVWPKDNPEYRWRVAGATVLLVGAKALNVTVRQSAMTANSIYHLPSVWSPVARGTPSSIKGLLVLLLLLLPPRGRHW